MSTSATRVVLADDEVLLREGLAGLLERFGFEVVGQTGNGSELIFEQFQGPPRGESAGKSGSGEPG